MWNFNKPYRRPWRVTLTYWLMPYARLRWVGLIVASIAVITGLILLLGYAWSLANQFGILRISALLPSSVDENTLINVLAALVGAVIGAVIAGVVSVSLQTQQYSSNSIIKKKAEIYEPLYNALIKFKKELEKMPPYQHHYETDQTTSVGDYPVYYSLWPSFRSKSSYLHVPRWLQRSLDHHLQEINDYKILSIEGERAAVREVQKVSMQESQSSFSPSASYDSLSLAVINDLITENTENIPHYFRRGVTSQLIREDYERRFLEASKEFRKLPEVQALIAHQANIVTHTDWLIKELERLIRYINSRHEAQGDLL